MLLEIAYTEWNLKILPMCKFTQVQIIRLVSKLKLENI